MILTARDFGDVRDFEIFWGFWIYDVLLEVTRGVSGVKMVVWEVWVIPKLLVFDGFFAVFLSFLIVKSWLFGVFGWFGATGLREFWENF